MNCGFFLKGTANLRMVLQSLFLCQNVSKISQCDLEQNRVMVYHRLSQKMKYVQNGLNKLRGFYIIKISDVKSDNQEQP